MIIYRQDCSKDVNCLNTEVKVKGYLITCQCSYRGEEEANVYPFSTMVVEWGGWPLYPHEITPVPIVEEAGWAPGLVWTG
jgi:hypothetical protein